METAQNFHARLDETYFWEKLLSALDYVFSKGSYKERWIKATNGFNVSQIIGNPIGQAARIGRENGLTCEEASILATFQTILQPIGWQRDRLVGVRPLKPLKKGVVFPECVLKFPVLKNDPRRNGTGIYFSARILPSKTVIELKPDFWHLYPPKTRIEIRRLFGKNRKITVRAK